MANTLIYSPGIKVQIATEGNGVIDVSEDIVTFQLDRIQNGVSSFQCTLQNQGRKYDRSVIFQPNDRIFVWLKRLGSTWLPVFGGYLNGVPYFSAYSRTVNISASCSLKRLQYWLWDSGSQASANLLNGSFPDSTDGGVELIARELIVKVATWPQQNIHIGAIPPDWYNFANQIEQTITTDNTYILSNITSVVGQGSVIAGIPTSGTSSGALTADQIAALAQGAGFKGTNLVMAIAICFAESGGNPTSLNHNSDGTSDHGLWQINDVHTTARGGPYDVTRLNDPDYNAAAAYVIAGNGTNWGPWSSYHNGAYLKFLGQAQSAANGIPVAPQTATQIVTSTAPTVTPGTKSNNASLVAQKAYELITTHPNIPYFEGNDGGNLPTLNPPRNLDCSSLVRWAVYQATGVWNPPQTRVASEEAALCTRISVDQALRTKGALLFISSNGTSFGASHVGISLGNGQVAEAINSRDGVHIEPYTFERSWSFGGLLNTMLDYTGCYNPSITLDTSTTPTAPDPGANGSTPTAATTDPISALFNVYEWVGVPDPTSELLSGPRALMNDSPLLPYIGSLLNTSMRSWCSAPNGDFMAWFPDYFGIWGTAAIMVVEDIELQDFSMTWADTNLVTNQYVVGSITLPVFNQASGSFGANAGDINSLFLTSGIASVEIPEVMAALFNLKPDSTDHRLFSTWIYKRYGARVNMQTNNAIPSGGPAEFFMALFEFMQAWAMQFNADIPITFMPELWPGMLVQLPNYKFQAYVTSVTHSGQMGPNGGFQTTVNVAAPSALNGSGLYGLPAGGRGVGNIIKGGG